MSVLWAGKHSRFTQLFEAFAVEVILASRSLTDVGRLFGLSWHQLHPIIADIVHDKFHISKYINDAVDKTRSKEHRRLLKRKDERLKGMEHLSDESLAQVNALADAELGVAKAWYLKELYHLPKHFMINTGR